MPAAADGSLRSMTGYGRGAARNPVAAVEAEMRSVNGRSLSVKLRLPPERLELEPRVEALIRSALTRGSVQVQIRIRILEARASTIDRAALRRYLADWRAAEREIGLERRDPSLSELLSLPGTVQQAVESSRSAAAVRRAVLEAAGLALQRLCESRAKEGEKLRRELRGLLDKLEKALARVEKRLPAAREEAAARLAERVRQALEAAGMTEPIDLARELIVLAERSDVREEVARLRIHLERLRALLERGGPVGRELDFLVQECHREVTTLGNKSSDGRLAEQVMAMKLLVAQLKEQSANVE
ncbi:MAG: YicC family protein [Planctomycetota bacterium]|nr:MAG: YicC family protein [Planctomycetota bacterium]